MAGLWTQSLTFVPDANGKPIPGARAFFYEADTLTPRDAYQDYGLGVEHTWPVVANGRGIFPAVYLEDGFFRIRITDPDGNVIPGYDLVTLPVIGPTQGGGGEETPVDPNALLRTGDVLWAYRDGVRDGFVRLNGRTIGSGTSGATERANSDVQGLYEFLWAADPNLEVTGGRGANATSDFEANKPMALPDARAAGLFGLAGMGNTAVSLLDNATFDQGDATTLGSYGGDGSHTLIEDELPEIDLVETGEEPEIPLSLEYNTSGRNPGANTAVNVIGSGPNSQAIGPVPAHKHTIPPFGGGEPHNNMPPFLLGTFYIKL